MYRLCWLAKCDTSHAGGDGPTFACEFTVDLAPYPFGSGKCGLRSNSVQQDDELISAKPADHVSAPSFAKERLAKVLQDAISLEMAERIVQLLESVEIDVKDSKRPGVLSVRIQHLTH